MNSILQTCHTIFQPLIKELPDASRYTAQYQSALGQEGYLFREKEHSMKKNRLSLHKTRIVITGLIVVTILALTLSINPLHSFAKKNDNPSGIGGTKQCVLDHLNKAISQTDINLVKSHINMAKGCLG